MAAAQCRSSKCSAERKGFRRELDSWRHKLIHCVGFESILEGIYGPLLLRDLSIFDDCEPEEVDDWSAEASCSHCSFCNLPLDKQCDHVPAAASPLSSPSDYSPSQAPPLSDSSQSAQRFLQAVFNKKDVPSTCDSSIPLVAQELMKKMIHQFAIEYASKSQLHTARNGLTSGSSSPLSDAADPDAPLDLTMSRNQENHVKIPQPDGVLDLSKRNSACSAASSPASRRASGFLLPTVAEEVGDPGRQLAQSVQGPALKAVFCSLCPAHRSLLYQILKLAYQEGLLSLPHCSSVSQTDCHCYHRRITPPDNVTPHPFPFSDSKACSSSPHYPLNDCDHQGHRGTPYHPTDSKSNCSIHQYPFSDCKSPAPQASGCCCVQSCRVAAYPVFCLKNLHCISCQSLAVEHINCSFASSPSLSSPSLCSTSSTLFPSSSLCPASSICCSHHSPHPCPCYANHACPAQVSHKMEGEEEDGDPPILKREPTRSPSPPPLSPIHSDINGKTEEKPPSLLHHRDEDDPSPPPKAKDGLENVSQQEAELETVKEGGRSRAVQNPSGSLLQDVMDRFSEKLETIRPMEKDLPLTSTANQGLEKLPLTCSVSQSLQSHADAHLSEIITTVLHAGSDSDYNLSELFHRHDNNEAKSPNTRSRRRQEVLANMTTSPDHASTRRHTLQIKRELAMLDLSYCRRKLSLAKRVKLKVGKNVTSPPSSSSSDTTPVKEESEREIEIQEMKRVRQEQEMVKIGEEEETASAKMGEDRKDREMESVTTKVQGGKINEGHEMEKGGEDGRVDKIRQEEGMLTTDGERNEIKEEIETVIVTEEIELERIKIEGAREMATEEEEQVASDTPAPTTGPQNKSYKPDAQDKALGHSCACNKGDDRRHFENMRSQEDTLLGQTCDSTLARGKDHPRQVRGRKRASFPSQPCSSREAGRSRRNIIPPQRFASYVTEPRKMYFAACFSESIFNLRTPKDKILEVSGLDAVSINSDVRDTPLELREALPDTPDLQGEPTFESMPEEQFRTSNSEAKDQNQVTPVMVATTKKSPSKHSSQNRTDVRDSAARPYGRLRSSQKKLHDSESETASRTPQKSSKSGNYSSSVNCVQSHPNYQTQYTSPIKLMYVSPVMDEKGVKYSLKSASGSSGQGEETFDPCEESSWAGTPKTSPGNEDVAMRTSPPKYFFSPRKSATSSPKSPSTLPKSTTAPTKSAHTPPKPDSTPPKSASSPPKSTSSSPKVGPKRLGESTPPKRGIGTENQRSPGSLKGGCEKQNDPVPFHELTPPKRRPGRPKKLGPQLEKKVKRPIGRPRKQKVLDVKGANAENVKAVLGPDKEEKANKNLKITVVYGRSRRNKRLVSEGCGQIQTELPEPWHAVDRNGDLSNLTQNSQAGSVKATSSAWSEEFDFVRPVKDRESAFHSSSNIKCQKLQGAISMRKPGRPAKVKISGISVTVTTVSPRQRKIQINKDARQSPETLNRKRALLPEFKSAKEPWTISVPSSNDSSQTEGRVREKEECKDKQPDRPVAVRHSVRVRKPSIYLLHSVATSRSYSHSTALLRRSRQLLLNKASNLRRQEEAQGGVEVSGERRQLFGQRRKQICHDLSQVAGVSVDSIFPPGETLKWWSPSAEEDTLKQELARRIRLVSDTWVSDTVENQEEVGFKPTLSMKGNGSFSKRSKHSSVVRMLFDCPPRKPRSCSMQQLCSWFMQTTETQSLAIVKKASSRNPYELMHYPRSTNKGSVCPSPQAERLRKHIKKFAKTVPKSPSQHQRAQERLWEKATSLTGNTKRQLFTQRFSPGRLNQGAPWWRGRALGKYSTTLLRAKARFLTRREREKWPKRQRNNQREMLRWRLAVSSLPGHIITALQPRHKAFSRLATGRSYNCVENNYTASPADHTQEPMDAPKEQRLSSKAWSPETLKECRVFLKKINSPDNESTAEEWDSCTVTLDDGSPSAFLLTERELEGDIKAVKTEMKKRKKRRGKMTTSLECQEQDGVLPERQNGKWKNPGDVSGDPLQPPPAKMLRQSRVRGLTGPRWCDFVFGN